MVPSPRKTAQRQPQRGVVPTLQARKGLSSGASAAAHCQVAHLVEEHRALQRIHLCDVRCEFGQERITENRRSLFMSAAARITKQITNVDLERRGQPRSTFVIC